MKKSQTAKKGSPDFSLIDPKPASHALKHQIRRGRLVVFGLLIVSMVASTLIGPLSQANAADSPPTITANQTADQQAQSFAYYKALRLCMIGVAGLPSYKNSTAPWAPYSGSMSAQDAAAYTWFNGRTGPTYDNKTNIGQVNDTASNDGNKSCGDDQGKAWLKQATTLWGYSSGPQFLCALGFTRAIPTTTPAACAENTGADARDDFTAPDEVTAVTNLDNLWTGKMKNSSTDFNSIVDGGGAYALIFDSFKAKCDVTLTTKGNTATYTIQDTSSTTTPPAEIGYTRKDQGITTNQAVNLYVTGIVVVSLIPTGNITVDTKTCQQLADVLDGKTVGELNGAKIIAGYLNYLLELKTSGGSNGGSGCGVAGTVTDPTTGLPCHPADTNSCAIDGIGWIICPVVNFMAGIADGAFGFLASNFLVTSPKIVDTSSPTYTAWTYMRTIANVAFVIVFLIIIFSQLTSIGVSNYGVKKLLPRIVIAAILVNISFFVTQIAVDVSNILGFSLKDLFDNIANAINAKTISGTSASDATAAAVGSIGDPTTTGSGFAGIAGTVLIIGAAGVAGYAMLSTLIPILLAAVVALLMIFFILVARQAIIVLLIVVSPLAFVAFLLPNTEGLFKQWRKMLTSMLLLFPIVAVVFGASTLASTILKDTFIFTTAPSTDEITKVNNTFREIIGAALLVLPLFAVPVLLKKSLDGIPALGSAIKGLQQKASGGAKSLGKDSFAKSRVGQFQAYRKGVRSNRRAIIQSGAYKGRGGIANPRNWASNVNKGLNKASGKFGSRIAATGISTVEKAEAEEVAAQQANLERQIAAGSMTADDAFNAAINRGDSVAARAALNVKFQTKGGRDKAHDLIAAAEANGSFRAEHKQSLQQHIAKNHPSIDTQDNTLARWSHNDGSGTITGLEHDPETYNINDQKMAGQTKKGLVEAFSTSRLDSAGAARILASEVLSKDLKPDEREFLTHISGGGAARPTDTGF